MGARTLLNAVSGIRIVPLRHYVEDRRNALRCSALRYLRYLRYQDA
jgi:hypothetical protein